MRAEIIMKYANAVLSIIFDAMNAINKLRHFKREEDFGLLNNG